MRDAPESASSTYTHDTGISFVGGARVVRGASVVAVLEGLLALLKLKRWVELCVIRRMAEEAAEL